MTEAAAVFNQTNSERSIQKNSAFHKKNGTAVTKLGNRKMSWQEIAEKHGECVNYDLGAFMTFSEFEKCPVDLKVEYVNKLMDTYDIELQHISLYLFHKGTDGLKSHLRNQKMKDDRALKFCDYQKPRAKSGLLKFQADIEEWKRREATAKEIDEMEAQRKRDIIWNAEFITLEEFVQLSLDGQVKYCNNLIHKHQVSLSTISEVLFEKGKFYLRHLFNKRNVSDQIYRLPKRGPKTTAFNEVFRAEVEKWRGEETDICESFELPSPIDEAEVNDEVEEPHAFIDELDNDINPDLDMNAVFYDPDRYERWKTRKKSLLVKTLFSRGKDLKDIFPYLDSTEAYFNTKLARNSFSFDDLIIIANAEGLHFGLLDDDGELQFSIKYEDWFKDYDEKVYEVERRIKHEHDIREEKRKEYEKLKAKLAEMNKMYEFE